MVFALNTKVTILKVYSVVGTTPRLIASNVPGVVVGIDADTHGNPIYIVEYKRKNRVVSRYISADNLIAAN